ncbi:MAG: response regulator [Bacteroidales bacterium]|nr:response regulator [Bacteroidales bacterium]MDD3430746.1 response regulator [Bacteroidales bacterium]MDD4360960.1 response regulator [Bacteroidales bacterium]MDD4429841.1 response regulator [Bacteroidales bacterium]
MKAISTVHKLLIVFIIAFFNLAPAEFSLLANSPVKPFVTYNQYSSEDEFLQGSFTYLLQDRRGLIWVSSFNGLNKFDGYQWTKYKSRPGEKSLLNTNRINYLWENSSGNLWCEAGSQIYLFDVEKEEFTNIQTVFEQKYLRNVNIKNIFPLDNGVSYFVSEVGECFRIEDSNPFNTCQEIPIKASNLKEVFLVFLDSRGFEWIFTSSGTYRYDMDQTISKIPFRFPVATRDELWFTSADGRQMGIYSYRNEKITYLDFVPLNGYVYKQHFKDSLIYSATGAGFYLTSIANRQTICLSKEIVQTFFVDSRGCIWGLTTEKEIVKIIASDFGEAAECQKVELPADHFFSDSRVNFYEDKSGLLWVYFFDTNDILYYNALSGQFERPISPDGMIFNTEGVALDKQGNLWYRINRQIQMLSLHNQPFEVINAFPGEEVRSMLKDSKSRYWFGLRENRVLCFQDNILVHDIQIEGTAYCLYEDSNQRIWIGSKPGGLYCLEFTDNSDNYKLSRYQHDTNDPKSLSHNDVYSIVEDSQGHLWIGTFGGGINLFNQGTFHHQNNHLGYDSELPETIRFICEIRPGLVLIGARNGLFSFNNQFDHPENIHMFHNTKRSLDINSLPDNDVMSILVTKDSTIYLTTSSGGICRILSKTDELLSDNIRFESITKEEGLASDVAYSIIEDCQNDLWITSGRALSRLQVKSDFNSTNLQNSGIITIYDRTSFPSEVVFSEGHPIARGDMLVFGTMNGIVTIHASQVHKDIYTPPLLVSSKSQNLKSRHQARAVSIHFAALDYHDKLHLKYAYKLDGVDKEWNITAENTVTYINLPPGNNLFHVKSTNADGIWTDNEQTMLIYIKPHFRETLAGRLILISAILLFITLVVYYFLHLYRLRHRLALEQENTNSKLRFFTDISHELRTPLTLIDGPVAEVLEDKQLSEQSRYYLEVVQKNVRRLLNLVNQILDFRKLQHNKMALLIEPLDVKVVLSHIMENFAELAHQHRILFSLSCPDDLPVIWADRDKIEKIFFNLLSNAFKYSKDGDAIRIDVSKLNNSFTKDDESSVVISVTDQGKGIKREDVEQLFSRFETIMQDNLFRPSSGIGLSLVKQFVDLHHADISVNSQPGEGSIFNITFCGGKKHFENDKNIEYYAGNPGDNTLQEQLTESHQENNTEEELPKILVVEDNEELRHFICHILAADYQVICANDGEEGLRIGKIQWPDLIITDIMMPKMDGFEMIRHIKADADIYAVPLIVLTAKSEMDDRIHGVELGVDDYVLKPFSASYLKARVKALLEQRRQLQKRFLELLSQGGNALARHAIEPNMPVITPADELFVQEALAFMENNMDNAELTIDQFADALKMGRTVFYNKLKTTLGLTPIDFVQEMRIKRAVQLMKSGDFTIAEIAYQTGFNDPKYFSRSFKKHLGCNPSEYIRSIRK